MSNSIISIEDLAQTTWEGADLLEPIRRWRK